MKNRDKFRGLLGERKVLNQPETVEPSEVPNPELRDEMLGKEVSQPNKLAESRRTTVMTFEVTKCEAASNTVTVFFSEDVDQSLAQNTGSATNPNNYTIYAPPLFIAPTKLSSVGGVSIDKYGRDSAVKITFPPANTFSRGNMVMITAANIASKSGNVLDDGHATVVGEVNGKSALRVVSGVANPTNLMVYFSEPLDTSLLGTGTAGSSDPNLTSNYSVAKLASGTTGGTAITIKSARYDSFQRATLLELDSNPMLSRGQWVLVTVDNVASESGPITNGGNNTFSMRVGDGVASEQEVKLKKDVKEATNAVEDAVTFPVLTEQVSFPTGAPASFSNGGTVSGSRPGASLGQIANTAINEVLGWKTNSTDPKGFIGALTQSFSLSDLEGRTEATWVPRTYAVQTDLGGGITGAQASLYTRAKDALDKAFPLLDGLYPLDPDADPEYVKALREMARSQMTEILKQLGAVGGPSILRVNTYFDILLGQKDIIFDPPTQPVFDPDQVGGTLGTLRDTFGIYFLNNPFSNSIGDEQNITNFRVISDYMTSLLQSWISNGKFFQLGSTQQNFFGTQLVLLSRQFSVVAETVNELRFTLDSVFIGPSERQTLLLKFKNASLPPMFLEDVLREVEDFATNEGPRLLQDGGRISVTNNVLPVLSSLNALVHAARKPANAGSLPDGYRTARVQRALEDLDDQIKDLINLAIPVSQDVPPPVQEPSDKLTVLKLEPSSVEVPKGQIKTFTVVIFGTDFRPGVTLTFTPVASNSPNVTAAAPLQFLTENLVVAQVKVDGTNSSLPSQTTFSFNVNARNPNGAIAPTLLNGFSTTWTGSFSSRKPEDLVGAGRS